MRIQKLRFPQASSASLTSTLLTKIAQNSEIQEIIRKANFEYLHWDEFRHKKFPDRIPAEAAFYWAKITRQLNIERTPVRDETGKPLSFSITKKMTKALSIIDSKMSGSLHGENTLPQGDYEQRAFIMRGLAEEAIASSQIEGASTTHRVAMEMIENDLPPKTDGEKMILNNYLAMKELRNWDKRPLDEEFLLELHEILTAGTLEKKEFEGRFRDGLDDVVVKDKLTGEIVHTPPSPGKFEEMLAELYAFANHKSEDDDYIHPFVKACILHYALAYIHPFVDGNGRMARMLFYWFLIKSDYWMIQYVSVSGMIKTHRGGYDKAFLYCESDDQDLTYFIMYKMKITQLALAELLAKIAKNQKRAEKLLSEMKAHGTLNDRQLSVIESFRANPTASVDIEKHRDRFDVVYQTARNDLLDLTKLRILRKQKRGARFVFTRGEKFPTH